jgi:hypothetical protein
MISRPPSAGRGMALETERGQIKLVNKQINHAHKVIFPDPVVQPLREKRRLISADTLDETCHAKPPNRA